MAISPPPVTSNKPPLFSAADALSHLLKNPVPVEGFESVLTQEALGRVLAEDIVSTVDVPPLDNTSMDGYAVATQDITAAGAILKVDQRIPAGSVGEPLKPKTIARIFTGAPIPPGADAVVMQEDCAAQAQSDLVQINTIPNAGQWIRRRGEDLSIGKVALSAGTVLRPRHL